MSNVVTSAPVPRPTKPQDAQAAFREQIEVAAQAALDTADKLIAILDQMDGNPRRRGRRGRRAVPWRLPRGTSRSSCGFAAETVTSKPSPRRTAREARRYCPPVSRPRAAPRRRVRPDAPPGHTAPGARQGRPRSRRATSSLPPPSSCSGSWGSDADRSADLRTAPVAARDRPVPSGSA